MATTPILPTARTGLSPQVIGLGLLMSAVIAALAGTVVWQRSQIATVRAAAATAADTPAAPATTATASANDMPANAGPAGLPAVAASAAAGPPSVPLAVAVARPAAPVKPRVPAVHRVEPSVPPPPVRPGGDEGRVLPTQSADGAVMAPAPVADTRAVPPPPISPVCTTCGVVESVEPVQIEGQASGTGAVVGGVAGAVVGNQFGKGGGGTTARILGAVGGALVGHAIEKNAHVQTVYRVHLRMEDGSHRSVTEKQPLAVGSRVMLQGEHLQVRSAPSAGLAVSPDGR